VDTPSQLSDTFRLGYLAAKTALASPPPAVVQGEREALMSALKEAATSLETLSSLSGRNSYGDPPIKTHMDTFLDVRLYAAARAKVAREAIAALGASTPATADKSTLKRLVTQVFGEGWQITPTVLDKRATPAEPTEHLMDALVEIAEFAHDKSTGPAVPDALWEIRDMAYGALASVEPATPPAESADARIERDVLLRVIQRLNGNPYNLTKSECISEVEAMRAAMGTPPAGEQG
jgi:hypothetical protein